MSIYKTDKPSFFQIVSFRLIRFVHFEVYSEMYTVGELTSTSYLLPRPLHGQWFFAV